LDVAQEWTLMVATFPFMATDKVFIERLLERMRPLEVVAKPIFGEYGLYFNGENFALVCDKTLFIKVTEPGARLAGKTAKGSPYPGARPAFRVTKAKLEDRSWLLELIEVTSDALPLSKAKKKVR
jgi:TfoX/Sxy family transcriptional regulator of competence genes